ncbi:hypothetical protein EV13_2775 [Prochlorococcus sp. MIT 0702]|nr:hypothetical protein EV12_2727 [Prochlorococcus sp. MIT 0701]KGG25999.1 hypothetical protein EV13_2775 [Prochlorococcus sp. MIT 0702]KGG30821.1 hypothetical protein EV14_2758 [Prochlorococcus sp. MIT 0703]
MESRLILVSLSLLAAPILKAATLACGDTNLQRRAILAIGGNAWQSDHAIDRVQTLFCNSKVAA